MQHNGRKGGRGHSITMASNKRDGKAPWERWDSLQELREKPGFNSMQEVAAAPGLHWHAPAPSLVT